METIKKEVELSKETYEVGEAIAAVVKATGKALEDGWQPGQDIPAIVTSPISKLGSAISGVQKVPAEFAEKPVNSGMAIAYPIAEAVQVLIESLRK